MRTLRRGDTGPEVAIWQRVIAVTADGVFGPATEEATRAWQRAHDLVVDGIVGPKTWASALSPHEAKMLRGLDASQIQDDLPFKQLKAQGCEFVILRGQVGNDYFDKNFARNVNAALDAGIEPFPYSFAYILPTTFLKPSRAPKRQAALFVERALTAAPVLEGRPFFNDYEWPEVVARPPKIMKGWKEWGCSPKMIANWMKENAAETKRLSKRTTVIYLYDWWWRAVRDGAPAYGFPEKGDVSWASDYDLWMAWYVDGWPIPGSSPRVPEPFTGWKFWQWDGNGGEKLPDGRDADFCVFNGDKADLARFVKGEPAAATENEAA